MYSINILFTSRDEISIVTTLKGLEFMAETLQTHENVYQFRVYQDYASFSSDYFGWRGFSKWTKD